jgi:hypothetical protein
VGFVKQLRRSPPPGTGTTDEDCVITSVVQFCDLDRSMPPFLRSHWNPCVNLIFLDNQNHPDRQQIMLVAQHCRQFLQPPAPDHWPTREDHEAQPLGQSVYFNADGVRQKSSTQMNNGSVFMVTKMQIWELDRPTPPDETMAMIRTELNVPLTTPASTVNLG